jgi:hypothetical protein
MEVGDSLVVQELMHPLPRHLRDEHAEAGADRHRGERAEVAGEGGLMLVVVRELEPGPDGLVIRVDVVCPEVEI